MQTALIRRAAAPAPWLAALALLLWAWHVKDPHLLRLRAAETWAILGLCALLLAIALRRPHGGARLALCLLLLAAAGLAALGEAQFQIRRQAVLAGNLPAGQAIGRHFVVGYDDPDAIRPLVAAGLIGGLYVGQANARGKTAAELAQEIAALQEVRRAAGLEPLLIASDQEGGIVQRLSPPLPAMPALAALAASGMAPADLAAAAEAYGAAQGADLARVGVTVNLAPVADLMPARAPHPLDFHSLIARRAIAADAATVTLVAAAYARGLAATGVRATLKHFPGLGSVAADTHHFAATLATPRAQLEATDWRPFRAAAAATGALVMLAHVVLPEIDPDRPASASRAVVDGIIRRDWGHDGALITDDLTMAAAYDRGLCAMTVDALNAGVDLLLISFDHEKATDAIHCAARAAERGRIDAAMLSRSRARLDRLAQQRAR